MINIYCALDVISDKHVRRCSGPEAAKQVIATGFIDALLNRADRSFSAEWRKMHLTSLKKGNPLEPTGIYGICWWRRVTKLVVCNPAKMPAIGGGNKSDMIDAREVAELLRVRFCRRLVCLVTAE